jgi:hypothetical protein
MKAEKKYQNNPEQQEEKKKSNAGGISMPDFKIYKSHSNKNSMSLAQIQTKIPMEQIGRPKNKSTQLQHSILYICQKHMLQKRLSLQQMVLGKLDIHMQRTDRRSLSH